MASDIYLFLDTPFGAIFIALFGLILGSFLNVVVTRLPLMVEQEERRLSLLNLNIAPPNQQAINIAWPRSFCPTCRTSIRWRHNIPVISWLWLRGLCHQCKTPISVRYPVIEALSALLLVVLYMTYGPTLAFCFNSFFCLSLVAIAYIDWETGWLPDTLTLPLIAAGLLYSVLSTNELNHISPSDAIVGAVLGYGLFWLLNFVYRTLSGRDGLGYGDFKLVAALGAWLGWLLLPLTLLVAGLFGFLFGIALLAVGSYRREVGIRFGPFLAITGIGLLLANDLNLLPAYLSG